MYSRPFLTLLNRCFLIGCLLTIVFIPGKSQITVTAGGTLTGKTIWNADTIKVIDNLVVDTLYILAGSCIEFQGNFLLTVNNMLLASGAAGDTILFTMNDTTGLHDPGSTQGGWGGIHGAWETEITLNFCRIEFVKNPDEEQGALYGYFTPLNISNSCITDNVSNGIMGEFSGSSVLNMTESLVARNKGNGIDFDMSTVNIDSSVIRQNAGMGINLNESYIHLRNSVISYNGSDGLWGSFYAPYIVGNLFEYNQGSGLGIGWGYESVVRNNVCRYNTGIGLDFVIGSGDLVQNLIYNNALGMRLFLGQPDVINNTIINNPQGGIKIEESLQNIRLYNCILRNNGSGEQIICNPDQNTNLYYCNVEGFTSYETDGDFIGNIDADPDFMDPGRFNFRLSDYSPCINTGIIDTTGLFASATDLEGNPRIFDGRIDMGVFEYQHDNFHILLQPAGQIVCEGADAMLETNAIGGIVGYQWQKNGVNIPTATQNILMFDPAEVQDSGSYNCLILADDKTVSTDTVSLIVDYDFQISEQTASFTDCAGSDTILALNLSITDQVNYQWYKNNHAVAGAIASEMEISVPETQQRHVYYCMLSNRCKTIKSADIDVYMKSKPPAPEVGQIDVCESDSIPELIAAGENIRWYLDQDLKHLLDTGPSFDVLLRQPGVYHYYATQTSLNCQSNPSAAEVNIRKNPVIPLSGSYSVCKSVNMMLDAGSGFSNYTWNTGAETSSISIENAGTYSVTVTGENGCSANKSTTVTIFDLPVLQLAEDTTITTQDTLNLDAGSGFTAYEWNTGINDRVLQVYGEDPGVYVYSVSVTDQNNCSATDEMVVTIALLNVRNENTEHPAIVIYPNPVAEILKIKPNDDMNAELEIRMIDNSGRLVKIEKLALLHKNHEYEINVSGLQSGIYYVQVFTDQLIKTGKVVIQ